MRAGHPGRWRSNAGLSLSLALVACGGTSVPENESVVEASTQTVSAEPAPLVTALPATQAARPLTNEPRDERFGDPPPPPEQASIENGHLVLPGPVVFETGTGKLRPESDAILAMVEGFLRQRADVTLLRIEGHTDSDGNEPANRHLSELRAAAIATWLVAHGIDCTRLIPTGFAASKPIADNRTPEGKAKNRRIEFVIASLRGRAIGGLPVDGGGAVAFDPCR